MALFVSSIVYIELHVDRIFGFSLYFPVGSHSVAQPVGCLRYVCIYSRSVQACKGSFLPPTFMRCKARRSISNTYCVGIKTNN